MAAKLIDVKPTILVELVPERAYGILIGKTEWTAEEARNLAEEAIRLIERHVKPHLSKSCYLSTRYERTVVCEHCGSPWTETSTTYNGGCCEADQLAAPEEA